MTQSATIALIITFWQYVVLISIGAIDIGLVWWAMRRERTRVGQSIDPGALLSELDQLHRAGILTDDEFQRKQRDVLATESEEQAAARRST